jgi:predicted SAM-dependent methyltransferase
MEMLMQVSQKIVQKISKYRAVLLNPIKRRHVMRQQGLAVHLGCGDDHLEGFINVDQRWTSSVDLIEDLTHPAFGAGSLSLVFSNAFFEHVYRSQRSAHLQCIAAALQPDGACCYIGIPYFPNIARAYLDKRPGNVGPVFDLYNVYRYTHGDPEQAPTWWLGQLHKSLFDEREVAELLKESGFSAHCFFVYQYPGDASGAWLTMGFYASKASKSEDQLKTDAMAVLRQFDQWKLDLPSLQWI